MNLNNMDIIIKDIIEIFNLEGVELVRLSGLTKRLRTISSMENLSPEVIDNTIKKFKKNGIINYEFITYCPHCQEISYQIKIIDTYKSKICDSCKSIYKLVDGFSLIRE